MTLLGSPAVSLFLADDGCRMPGPGRVCQVSLGSLSRAGELVQLTLLYSLHPAPVRPPHPAVHVFRAPSRAPGPAPQPSRPQASPAALSMSQGAGCTAAQLFWGMILSPPCRPLCGRVVCMSAPGASWLRGPEHSLGERTDGVSPCVMCGLLHDGGRWRTVVAVQTVEYTQWSEAGCLTTEL